VLQLYPVSTSIAGSRPRTLDSYNEQVALYYLLPYDGSKGYKFGLENLGLGTSPNPTLGQNMSGWTDPDPGMPGEGMGELQFIIGNSGGGGSSMEEDQKVVEEAMAANKFVY
jgi:hypothetical protein